MCWLFEDRSLNSVSSKIFSSLFLAKQKISDENEKMEKAETAFLVAVEYFRWESEGKRVINICF